MNIRRIIREELQKIMEMDIDSVDLSPMMSLVNRYPDLIKYYKTPLPAHKFWINQDDNMYDEHGISLPKYEITYKEDFKAGIGPTDTYSWTIVKTDYTPNGRQRDKTTHRSEDINLIFKTAKRLINNLINKSKKEDYNEEVMKEDAEEGKIYTDSWDNKQYTSDEINKWISQYRKAYRMPAKDKNAYKAFFKRVGLAPKDYEKVKPKSILKLKKDGGGGYYAEGIIDDHKVRVTFEPQIETNGQWCFYWYVNDEEIYSDCMSGFKELSYDLDRQAASHVEDFKNGEHKKYS